MAESYTNSIFNFFEKLPYCFPQWLHDFAFATNTIGEFLFLHTLSRIYYL